MTPPIRPYVVLLPGRLANPTGTHLVVHVDEWVQVLLKKKDAYVFCSEHDSYESAAGERDELNTRPEGITQAWHSVGTSPTEDPPSSATADNASSPPTTPPTEAAEAPSPASAPAAPRRRRRLGNGKRQEAESTTGPGPDKG